MFANFRKKQHKLFIAILLISIGTINICIPQYLFAASSCLAPVVCIRNISVQDSFHNFGRLLKIAQEKQISLSKNSEEYLSGFFNYLSKIAYSLHFLNHSLAFKGILSQKDIDYLDSILFQRELGTKDNFKSLIEIENLLNKISERTMQLSFLMVDLSDTREYKSLESLKTNLKQAIQFIDALNTMRKEDVGLFPHMQNFVVIDKQDTLENKRTKEKIIINIETLQLNDLTEAIDIHNANWGDKFRIDYASGRKMFESNPGGHLVARDEARDIIGVIWCVSLSASSIEDVPSSLEIIQTSKRTVDDNMWLHYAVSVSKKYIKKGFGAQIATLLLKSTEPLSLGMRRGTYSPMSGYGKYKQEVGYSPMSYLMQLRPAKEGRPDIDYADYRYDENKMTLNEFLDDKGIDFHFMEWQDYLDFINYSDFTLGDFIRKTGRSLVCMAANLHLKNGAEIKRIIENGRKGDKDAGEYAMVIFYKDMLKEIPRQADVLEDSQQIKLLLKPKYILENKLLAVNQAI